MTIFHHDRILSICLWGNTALGVASICNGVMRKRKYHDQCKEISCLLPRDDVKLIRFIISQLRPFSSLYDQGSNCSLLERKSNIIMGNVWVITAGVELYFLGKVWLLAELDSWMLDFWLDSATWIFIFYKIHSSPRAEVDVILDPSNYENLHGISFLTLHSRIWLPALTSFQPLPNSWRTCSSSRSCSGTTVQFDSQKIHGQFTPSWEWCLKF